MSTEDDKRAASAAKEVSSAFGGVTKAVGRFIPGFESLGKEVNEMTSAFTRLSNTGNAFNNDMLGMRAAAANARMTLDEYAKVVEENRKSFTGLGGSVSQGTKVFGEFSKAFFESGLTENLRQMGYTSKDLNELLATQIGFQKSSTDNTVEGQMRTAKAAAELGTELDLIAKLTGVSRKEQEEALRKAATDGQVEAKMRLIGIEQGADAEKVARAEYAKQLAQAEAMGQGQLFKEMFATGTATSKEAQMSLALFGDASLQTAESAKQLGQANVEASKAAMENAKIANMQNQTNSAILSVAAVGIGDAGKAAIANVAKNDAAYQGLKQTMDKFQIASNDVANALDKQRESILKEQKVRDDFTSTIITANARLQDVRAGVVTSLTDGIKKSETLKTAAEAVRKIPGYVDPNTSNEALANKFTQDGGKTNISYATQELLQKTVGDVFKGMDKVANVTLTGVLDYGKKASEFIDKLKQKVETDRAGGTPPKSEPVKSREGGSIEMAGTMFEDWGKGTMAELHGLETVMKPDQMMNFAKGMGQQGASTAFNNMKGMLAGQDKGAVKGIDLSKISNEIKTTVSKVEITNWPKDLISKVEIKAPPSASGAAQKPAESKPAESKPAESKPADKANDKSAETQSRAEKAAKAAEEITIKSGDTLTSLAKKYNTSVAELVKANPAIKDANKIASGAKLNIPGKEPVQTEEKKATQASVRAADNAIDRQAEQKSNYTFNGKAIDANTEEGQKIIAQIEEAKKKVADFSAGLLGSVTTNFAEAEQASKDTMEEFKNMFPEMIPIQEVFEQQTEFKSKFTDEQRKFIEDYQGMEKGNQEFMKSALERSNSIDRESIAKHNGIVEDLQKKKNERELTAEEEHQLSESEAIARNISEDVKRRQEQLDMINNISTLADEVELERLDQQARKELDLMKATDEEKLDSTKAANDFIKEQFLMANDAILDSVGGMNDAVTQARDIFMEEINEMFDMPSEVIANAQDAMMEELNTMFDMPSEVIANAQDAMMEELNTMFDMPSDVVADAQAKFMEEINELFDMPERDEFAEDEYGEGGEDVQLPVEPEEDYIGLALKEFTDQVAGLKEFEEDEYGEGGEAIGGEMDSSFAEDEDSYVAEALKGFQDLIPDSMIGDAEFAAGPGDASVAGMDYAEGGPGDASVAGMDYAEGGPGDASVAGMDFVTQGANRINQAMADITKTLPQAKSGSEPAKQEYSKIDMGDFTLGPDGMPIAKPKQQAQNMANKVGSDKEKKEKDDKDKAAESKAAGKTGDQAEKKEGQKEGDKKGTKTLDDVVKTLEQLNSNIGRLTTKVEEASRNQIQATKSLNGNLYNVS